MLAVPALFSSMTRRMTWLALTLGVLSVPMTAHAQPRDSMFNVMVNRSARLPAQRAVVLVAAEATAESAAEALTRVQRSIASVTTALRTVPGVVISDTTITVGDSPGTRGGFVGQTPSVARLARGVLRVHAPRREDLIRAMAAAIDAGARVASATTYESEDADSVRHVLLREATAAARRDAEVMAAALGGRVGALVSAGVNSNSGYMQPTQINFDASYGPQQMSEQIITVNVTLSFRLLR